MSSNYLPLGDINEKLIKPNNKSIYPVSFEGSIFYRWWCTVGHKSHDPCFNVFLMEARVMTFVAFSTSLASGDTRPERQPSEIQTKHLT